MSEPIPPSAGQRLDKVLIVEDSKMFCSLLSNAIQNEFYLAPTVFSSMEETKEHLEGMSSGTYFAALLDLNLPDAPNGEIVDYVTSKGIPAIVFTGNMSDEIREMVWSKRITNYILKENMSSVEQVIEILKRLQKNIGVKILVAEDSPSSRSLFKAYLESWNFTVIEAKDGKEAFDIIEKDGNNISLLLSDNYMPKMDGITLTKEVRRTFSKTRMPIIGMSGEGGATGSAFFLKSGANDYIHKPFLAEELYCRVVHNIETSEYISTIRDMAEKDFLTNIYNRRSFFNYGQKLFSSMKRGNVNLTVAMLDIDHFKKCNDIYGHDAGDRVICSLAKILSERFRNEDIVARMGGEEFCVCCVNMDEKKTKNIFEALRKQIETTPIVYKGQEIRISISIGICQIEQESLNKMITCADQMLYKAKENGRNQIQIAQQ